MPVLENIALEIDPKEVVLALHHGKRAPKDLVSKAEFVLAQCKDLLEPRAVYEWINVIGQRDQHVVVSSPRDNHTVDLRLGPHADLMAHAKKALVSVTTIGDKLEHYKDYWNNKGHILNAYLADSIGVVALEKAGQAIRTLAERQAQCVGWGLSPALAPGSLIGWPLTDQRRLSSLVPIEEIRVHLTESGVLKPFKSVSSMIGIGPGYSEKKVGSVCKYCNRAETCWRRR